MTKYSKYKLPFFYGLISIAVAGLFVLFLIRLLNNYITVPWNKKKIKKNYVIFNGAVITEMTSSAKTSDLHAFTFSYYSEKRILTNKHNIGLNFKSNSAHYLMEKSLPVIYERGNPGNSRLLIVPKDFEYFEIPYPDTLQWIKDDVLY